MEFIDELKILLKSGAGGTGCVSFSSEPLNHRGGPDGGDGGRGGSVIFQVNNHLNSLHHLKGKRQLSAGNGQPGKAKNQTGARGTNLIIQVPPGTSLCNENHQELADLMNKNYEFLKGGCGGRGNNHFKSSTNQTPEQFQKGEPGITMEIILKMKLIADVGVIGLPNSGKSTLVSQLTGAKTRIGHYAFTTTTPQLGILKTDKTFLCLADIPGLIPGASRGVGLGIKFLRHIERTSVLVHLLDLSDLSDRNPWDDYIKINKELHAYDRKNLKTRSASLTPLGQRPQIVVFNKIDTANSKKLRTFEKLFKSKGINVLKISAKTKKKQKDLIELLLKQFKQ